jgi:hypothetical protein
MLPSLTVLAVTLSVLGFDMATILGKFYPGRETIRITGQDGDVYTYACKPGPAGEPPQEQAEKAQGSFEENVQKFAGAVVGGMMEDLGNDGATLGAALTLNRRTESWAGSMVTHMEKKYGCLLLG